MAKKKTAKQDSLSIYQSLVDNAGLDLKGAKSRYTSMNGNMFSFLDGEGRLALRLGRDDREEFLATHKDSVCVQHGHVMKEYVLVPEAILHNRRELEKLFGKCRTYASSLKPKPTSRKSKKTPKVNKAENTAAKRTPRKSK